MKLAVFSTKPYDEKYFEAENKNHGHDVHFFEAGLSVKTAPLAKGYGAVCIFVNDIADEETINILSEGGTKVIALRCAGFNNVDLKAAEKHDICVVRVPAYSPYAVAEHTIGIMLSLDRNIHRAHYRVREGNFALNGLLGFDLHGKTAGIIGTGRIGAIVCNILKCGFGCEVLAFDKKEDKGLIDNGIKYVDEQEIFAKSDIISLHCPLTPETPHLIDEKVINSVKRGLMLINTSRGALIDTAAVIEGLKDGRIGSLGLDVYEEEGDLFFEDLSNQVIRDDTFSRLQTFPNVLITGHQAYFTREALQNIAQTTLDNLDEVEKTGCCDNAVLCCKVKAD